MKLAFQLLVAVLVFFVNVLILHAFVEWAWGQDIGDTGKIIIGIIALFAAVIELKEIYERL